MFGPIDLYAPGTLVPPGGWISSIFPHDQEVGDQLVIELNVEGGPLHVCMMAGIFQPHGFPLPAVPACYKDFGVLSAGAHHIYISPNHPSFAPALNTWVEATPVDPVAGAFGAPLTKHVVRELPPPWFGFVVCVDGSDPLAVSGKIQGTIWYYNE